ncbi:LOW QUALITY PROTEIN: hypothetical protein ACHAWF_000844 [Thalassiosira exigua]
MPAGTVKFNVGGRFFEVSRSLIDPHSDTMIERLVLARRSKGDCVIDWNGDTFAYVLDYLRYGR